MEVTASVTSSASPLAAPSAAMSERTPVEVSACTAAYSAGAGWASSIRWTSTGCPHSCSTATTSAPQRAATSHIRWPNRPFTPTTTTSPSWTVLTNAASMPALPVALIGRVRALVVPQAWRSSSHVSSMMRRNSGSRCPSSGRLRALVASGYGLDGPGPKRCRSWITVRRYRRRSVPRAGVEDALRVEGVLDPQGQRHHVRTELRGQGTALGAADAVLARDGAAEGDGRRHHLVEGQAGATLRVGVRGVVHDVGVGVAVAGVGDDGDLHAVPVGDGGDRVEEVGQQRHGRTNVLEQQRPAT